MSFAVPAVARSGDLPIPAAGSTLRTMARLRLRRAGRRPRAVVDRRTGPRAVAASFDAAAIAPSASPRSSGTACPTHVVAAMVDASDRFFALPLGRQARRPPARPDGQSWRTRPRHRSAVLQHRGGGPARSVRGLQHGRGRTSTTRIRSIAAERHRLFAPNIWPAGLEASAVHWSTTSPRPVVCA